MRTWTCKIGECDDADLLGPGGKYYGADAPMRLAMREAYIKVTGKEPVFLFSGWGGQLDATEREIVSEQRPERLEKDKGENQ